MKLYYVELRIISFTSIIIFAFIIISNHLCSIRQTYINVNNNSTKQKHSMLCNSDNYTTSSVSCSILCRLEQSRQSFK